MQHITVSIKVCSACYLAAHLETAYNT
jgi:hypothetical protein